MPKLSIIIPVYNASATVLRSLESITEQSYKDYEIVVVNDCSKDNSLEIIESFLRGKDIAVTVIAQTVNTGVAAARNRGLAAAVGDYICFVDADDELAPGALSTIVNVIESTKADVIGWDWNLCFEKNSRYMAQRDYKTPEDAIMYLFCGVMRWNLWLFSYRRQMLCDNHIAFLDGENMGEDMQFTLKALRSSSIVAQIRQPLYNYNAVNEFSISKQFSVERRKEVSANISEVERIFPKKAEYYYLFQFLKLNIKLPLLVSGKKSDFLVWKEWMSEANSFSMKNKLLPLRTRLLQLCADKGLWPVVKLYHIMVYRVIYGVLFK